MMSISKAVSCLSIINPVIYLICLAEIQFYSTIYLLTSFTLQETALILNKIIKVLSVKKKQILLKILW